MGYLSEPPKDVQIAAAQDYLMAIVEAVRLAEAMMISKNLRYQGTIAEQESFALIWSEIRGMAARALTLKDKSDRTKAEAAINQAVNERVVQNKAFDKFRTGVAGTDDPLMR